MPLLAIIWLLLGLLLAGTGPAVAQTATAKPENDWSRLINDLLPAMRSCLQQPAVPVERILKAWPMNHGMVGVRLRSPGGHRFDCLVAQDGSAVLRLTGLMPEDVAVPGEGNPAFLPMQDNPPPMRVGGLERVVDAAGVVQGWLYYAQGSQREAMSRDAANRLYGTWRLDDLASGGVVDNLNPPVTIERDGSWRGETGCNRMSGKISVKDDVLQIGSLATTRRACAPAAMDQERRYLKALKRVARWRIETELLVFVDASGAELMRFARAEK